MPKEISIVEPSLSAGQNNLIYKEVSFLITTHTPSTSMQAPIDSKMCGDVAYFLCLLAGLLIIGLEPWELPG